jgi:hypothetical protein
LFNDHLFASSEHLPVFFSEEVRLLLWEKIIVVFSDQILVVHPKQLFPGGIEKDKIRAAYNIPADTEVAVAFALGYQADESVLPDDLRERELTPRARKDMSEIVFAGSYGTPAKL